MKNTFPHVIIILVLLLMSIAYVSPPIFESKRLIQNDVIQSESAAKELVKHYQATGTRGLWSSSMFAGMPAFLINMDYPYSLTTHLGRLVSYAVPAPANGIFIYFMGFYVMALLLGFSPYIGGLGAILYGLGTYNIINIETGHLSKVFALGFAPALIGAVIYAYRNHWLYGSALAGLFMSLQLYANHVQITYYTLLVLGIFGLFELIHCLMTKGNFKQFIIASFALLFTVSLAMGTHASRLWTNYEYTSQTIRGKSELKTNKESKGAIDRDYAFQWSYGIGESFTFLIPNFYGSGSGAGDLLGETSRTATALQNANINPKAANGMPFYWGAQPFTSGPAYMGAIVMFLALLGLMISKNQLKWWFFSSFVFLVFVAWGKNFAVLNYFLFDYLPLFNKFRAHTMTLSLAQLFVAVLALMALQTILIDKISSQIVVKNLKISGGIVAGLCLFFALLGGFVQDYRATGTTEVANDKGTPKKVNNDEMLYNNLISNKINEIDAKKVVRAVQDDRATMQGNDAWRSLILIVLLIGVLWGYSMFKFESYYALAGIALLCTIDMWQVANRYLNAANFKSISDYEVEFEPSSIDTQILNEKETLNSRYRVANFAANIFNDGVTSNHHHSVGGYSAVKLRRYQDLIDAHLSRQNMRVYSMLNTKYIISENEKREIGVSKIPTACGNAWFVNKVVTVVDANAELDALQNFEPLTTAFVDKRFEAQLKEVKTFEDEKAKIKLTKASPDELIYTSEANQTGLAVFSEIYYVQPDKIYWQAYIDGKKVPHLRTNYVLRGLVIPAGKHEIKFKFEVPIYHTGEMIALISSVLMLNLFIYIIYLLYQNNKKQSATKTL